MADLSLAPPSPLVSAEWLYAQLHRPDLVVVDCRFSLMQPEAGRQAYAAGHIPGAVYVHLNGDLSGPPLPSGRGGRHPLPSVDAFVTMLEALGIGNHTTVVAYDDSRFAFAARLWWLLRYVGHARVAILNGGFSGWCDRDYPTERRIPTPEPRSFIPQLQSDWVINRAGVKARLHRADVALIDSRSGERYRGEQEPIDPVAGHIPGAINRFWQEVTDEQGYSHSATEQHNRWRDVETAAEIVVYCGSGVTACVNLLSLELAGLGPGKLYAGSWSDWCSDPAHRYVT